MFTRVSIFHSSLVLVRLSKMKDFPCFVFSGFISLPYINYCTKHLILNTMKKTFDLYVMAFDGEIMLDSRHNTIEEAENTADNFGSKWFFYPWCFVGVGKTIKEFYGYFVNTKTGEPTMNKILKGKRIDTARAMFAYLAKETEGYYTEEFESEFIDRYLKG